MKKILKSLFSLLVVLGLVSVAVACNKKTEEPEHTHAYGDEWKHDETNHWKECSCGEVSEKAAHAGGEATYEAKAVCTTCGQSYGELKPKPEPTYSYHVVGGHFDDWNNYTADNLMTKISVDELSDSLKAQLADKEISGVYLLEGREYAADGAWTTPAYVGGDAATDFDGGFTVKVVYACYDPVDAVSFAQQWNPDPKTSAVQNLTPETLFIPKWVETPAAGEEHLGKWDQNPVITAGAGLYDIYFVEYAGANSAESPKYAMAAVRTGIELTNLITVAEGDQKNYKVTTEKGVSTIAVDKQAGSHWSSISASVADATGIQSLSLTISGDCVVKLKVESSAGGKEVDLQLDGNPTVWEWKLHGEEEQKILAGENVKFVLFALPNEESGKATITLEEVYFLTRKAQYNTMESGFTNIKAPEENKFANKYDGVSETFDINDNWLPNDKDTYTFEKVGTDVNVTYKVGAWQFAVNSLEGEYQKFDQLTMELTGTPSKKLLVKIEGAAVVVEQWVEFTGEKQEVNVMITKHHQSGKDLTENERKQGYKVLLFAEGDTGGQGEFTIHKAELNKAEVVVDPTVRYDGSLVNDVNLNVGASWAGLDAGVYTVKEGSNTEVTYKKPANSQYSAFVLPVAGQFGNFEKLDFGFEIAEGVNYMIKVEGDGFNKELPCVGTGAYDDKNSLDLTSLTVAQRDAITKVIIFVATDNAEANEGTFKIHWMAFRGFKYRGVGAQVYTGGSQSPDMNATWSNLGDAPYTFERPEGQPWTITYDKAAGQQWVFAVSYVLGGKLGNFNALEGGFKIAEDKQVLVKIEGDGWNKELWVTGTGEYQGFKVDLSDKTVAERNTINKVLLCAEGGVETAVAGSFEVHWMSFTGFVDQDIPEGALVYNGTDATFDVNKDFAGDDLYTITYEEGVTTLAFEKGAGTHWSSVLVPIYGDFTSFTKVNYDVTLSEGASVMIKLEGSAGNVEYTVSETGTGVIDLAEHAAKLGGLNKVVIFACPNQENVSGTITINTLEFAK